MKWFKHMSSANSDDKIVAIRNEFGMWGVGVYWTLVEMVAEQMKADDPKPEGSFLMSELSGFFACKRSKLSRFLVATQNAGGMQHTLSGNIVKITIPKLLQIKDNYTKDLEVSTKKLSLEQNRGRTEVEQISTVTRQTAASGKELSEKPFILRPDDAEFKLWTLRVRAILGRFQWRPTTGSFESDLRSLAYGIKDEKKRAFLQAAYNMLEERMNWLNYVDECIKLMVDSSRKKAVNEPYKMVMWFLKTPQAIISAKADGSLSGALKDYTK